MIFTIVLSRPLCILLIEPTMGFVTEYISLDVRVMFAFFDAYPYVLQPVYGLSLGQAGLALLGIIVGICLAVPGNPIRSLYFNRLPILFTISTLTFYRVHTQANHRILQ